MAVDITEFTRACAMGAASISDLAKTKTAALKLASQKQSGIVGAEYLRKAASQFDIDIDGRDDCAVASDLAEFFTAQFSWSDQPSAILNLAPVKLRQHWKSLGIEPSGIDSVVVEALANTGDPAKTCMKCGVADGWIGSLVATIASDILSGTPKPFLARIDPDMKIECKNFNDSIKVIDGPGNLSPDPNLVKLIAGFSNESIAHMLGGRFRAGFKVLSDAITDGRIRGIACVFGCSQSNNSLADTANELIKRNVIVLNIGCSVVELAKAGLLLPEAAGRAGETLGEMCEMIGMPPVLQMGSCYESIRILLLANELLVPGGLGEDFSDMPIAAYCGQVDGRGAAMASSFAASGIFTIADGSELSTLHFPLSAVSNSVDAIITHIESKRDDLKINQQRERKLLDMKERRELV